MRLKTKITVMVTVVILGDLSLTTIYSVTQMNAKIREKIEEGLTNLALSLSSNPIILEHIGDPDFMSQINSYANKVRIETDVTFIIITDMNKIRYSHPNTAFVGHTFSNDSIDPAIYEGKTYTVEGESPLGVTVKAFTPIIRNGTQVGVVGVGTLKENIMQEYALFLWNLLPMIVAVSVVGYFVAKYVAQNIKKTIYGLEPEEIAFLLNEREVILNNMTDGLIAINQQGQISIMNEVAIQILSCHPITISALPQMIRQTFEQLLEEEIAIMNLKQKITDQTTILSNYSLIKEENRTVGVILTFKLMREVEILIDELAGIKKLNCDLRAHNHEFMNKLQTISGLIHLEEYEMAMQYISEISTQRDEVLKTLERIHEVSITALLLGKYTRASEAKIDLKIHPKSQLEWLPKGINVIELGCIIGNLIENSIEAVKGQENGHIEVLIQQTDQTLEIQVENNGPKIKEEQLNLIFKRGFSTKGENRGFGLFNVLQIVEDVGGSIEVHSNQETTTWWIRLRERGR